MVALALDVIEASVPDLRDPELAARLGAGFLLGYSGHTRTAYASDLRDFGRWCSEREIPVLDVQRPHVEAYARSLEGSGAARATVARRLATLAGFYRYAVEEGALARSPVDRVRRPRVPDESPTLGLDRTEIARLLAAAELAGPRDHALLCLLALNGLRASEVCAANACDLDFVRGHRTVTVMRKGGSRVEVPLAPRTSAAIDSHLGGRTTGPLLLGIDGERLDRHQVARIVRRLARAAGISKRISPHSLRHSFVTAALDAGVTLRDVQDAAGHADPRTTRRYDRGRRSLDRAATYAVASYVASADE